MKVFVLGWLVYELFLKPKPPRGDVVIGDARVGSNPDEWAQWREGWPSR